MKKRIIYILAAFGLVLSACGNDAAGEADGHEDEAAHEGHDHAAPADREVKEGQTVLPNGDLQEVTASAEELPSFLDDKPEDMQLVYKVAGSATEILEWMPCYCGCGDSAGHKSNMNCFISEVREDGSVVWDDHGTRCLVCLEIAVESVKMAQDGKSLKEIRETIDKTYNEGYAEPTPTPMPA
ncbi:PCYCGC motif-containing (lipo)protein [Bhargavaea massiliensis]|uniref:PCYCGC motif-containing (lipo)protein n=1 Tax=Bhargavaea massiliensis TaxID=2697500 RepID=UPI001BCE92EE|nr:PCYCGC motif-containing (lipo)protein [Bhargavaea massiliensis]